MVLRVQPDDDSRMMQCTTGHSFIATDSSQHLGSNDLRVFELGFSLVAGGFIP